MNRVVVVVFFLLSYSILFSQSFNDENQGNNEGFGPNGDPLPAEVPPQYYSRDDTSENNPGQAQVISPDGNVSLGLNYGNAYTPPAGLFAQVVQVLGWANTTFATIADAFSN